MRRKSILVLIAAGFAAPAWGATAVGCAPRDCMPRTGAWKAPSPQRLVSYFGSTELKLTVSYRRAGRTVKSVYGNTLAGFNVYVRYFCPTKGNPWVETGFSTIAPIAIRRDGTVNVSIPASYAFRAHRLILKFKRTTFSGRLSGTTKSSTGAVCSASVSFSGKLRG